MLGGWALSNNTHCWVWLTFLSNNTHRNLDFELVEEKHNIYCCIICVLFYYWFIIIAIAIELVVCLKMQNQTSFFSHSANNIVVGLSSFHCWQECSCCQWWWVNCCSSSNGNDVHSTSSPCYIVLLLLQHIFLLWLNFVNFSCHIWICYCYAKSSSSSSSSCSSSFFLFTLFIVFWFVSLLCCTNVCNDHVLPFCSLHLIIAVLFSSHWRYHHWW